MTSEPYDVFLSYNSEDRDAVKRIAAHLDDDAKLRPWLDIWSLIPGEPWVENLKSGLETSSSCAIFVGKSGEGPWQQREVEAALRQQISNRDFRVIPVLLPEAPQQPELPMFLAGNMWVDLQGGLDDNEALWRLECGIRGVPPGRGRPQQEEGQALTSDSSIDPQNLIIPGGALDVDSPFYILRGADEEVLDAIHRPRGMVTVRGARQTGKTSLIMGVYAAARRTESQLRSAFVDFQRLLGEELQSLGTIWRAIAGRIARQIQVEGWSATDWNLDVEYDYNISEFLERFVFNQDERPLLICLDEVDCVFDSPIRDEFFASVRAFYNSGAIEPSWKKVRWLLGTSSEPSFFIKDVTQSPFNIGLREELNTFTPDEVAEFVRRHGLTLDRGTLDRIMDYVGGHPYLVHLLLYQLIRNPENRDQLFDAQTAGGGVFLSHLNRYLSLFQQDEALAGAIKNVINGEGCDDVRMAGRLEAAGLVRRDETQQIVSLCQLYTEFFRSKLQ